MCHSPTKQPQGQTQGEDDSEYDSWGSDDWSSDEDDISGLFPTAQVSSGHYLPPYAPTAYFPPPYPPKAYYSGPYGPVTYSPPVYAFPGYYPPSCYPPGHTPSAQYRPFHYLPPKHPQTYNVHLNEPSRTNRPSNHGRTAVQNTTPNYLRSSHNLPNTRERRLAVGLGENEEVLHYDFRPCGPDNASIKLTVWTTSKSSHSCSTRATHVETFHPRKSAARSSRNRFLFQFAGEAVAAYQSGGSPNRIISRIQASIDNASRHCIFCLKDIGTEDMLYRSTTCSKDCSIKLRCAPLEIRVPGLENWGAFMANRGVLEVLWYGAMMAIYRRQIRPPVMLTVDDVYHAVNKVVTSFQLPVSRSHLDQEAALQTAIQSLKQDWKTKLFVAWSAAHYRGCLVQSLAITGASFYLYNANPDIEKAYERNRKQYEDKSSIVFHGTTFDRLYPIMCDGFKYDNKFMQTGRVFGDGVYTTNNSTVALGYARHLIRPPYMTGHLETPFGLHVLLVCELLAAQHFLKAKQDTISKINCDIYVVDEPNMLILRAILIGTNGTDAPALSHETLKRAIQR